VRLTKSPGAILNSEAGPKGEGQESVVTRTYKNYPGSGRLNPLQFMNHTGMHSHAQRGNEKASLLNLENGTIKIY